jgi:hypothetical protein
MDILNGNGVNFICDDNNIKKYYIDNVIFKISKTRVLNINIVNYTYFLKMDTEIDLFYDYTKNYICLCDNKIVLILIYDVNNSYEIINDNILFINYEKYDLSLNVTNVLNNYSNNITFLKNNKTPNINDIENSFIIHIDENVERIQNIYNCNYIKKLYFVNAITYKNDYNIYNLCNYIIYRNYFIKELYEQNKYHSFSKGSICLALTNLLILNYCINNNIHKLLIFEDDLIPNKNLTDMQLFFNNKPSNADIILLNVKQDFRKPLKYFNNYFYYRNEYSWSMLSYCILNLNTINSLINYYSTFETPIDCYSFDNLNCYVSTKNFFIDNYLYNSDIRLEKNNKIEIDNIWKYNYDEYNFLNEKINFVMFNYKFEKTNHTWKNFSNSLYLQSNTNYYIDYDNQNINENSIVFFDFIDREFGWDFWKFEKKYPNGVPFKWGGIIHHPFILNNYWGNNLQVSQYLNNTYVKKCLVNCKFLIVLSEPLKNDIIQSKILDEFNIKIYVIYHITPLFNLNLSNTTNNNKKKLLFLGWSFRNYHLFYKIDTPQLKKIILPGTRDVEQEQRFNNIINIQTNNINYRDNIYIYDYIPIEYFLSLLSESVVFLDFDGISANNSIVECIKFNIPVIIRKCNETIFYLGENYPMYYKNEEDIYLIINNLDYYVSESINYLKNLDKIQFSMTTNTLNVLNIINDHI